MVDDQRQFSTKAKLKSESSLERAIAHPPMQGFVLCRYVLLLW